MSRPSGAAADASAGPPEPGWRKAVVLLAALATIALGLRLGFWQLDRAAQKVALQETLDTRGRAPPLGAAELARDASAAPAQLSRRVRLFGSWAAERTVFLDNRQMGGKVGFFVVTPLRLEGGRESVLVQRGWAPRNFEQRALLPAVVTPTGRVEVVGRIAASPSRLHRARRGRERADPAKCRSRRRSPARPGSTCCRWR